MSVEHVEKINIRDIREALDAGKIYSLFIYGVTINFIKNPEGDGIRLVIESKTGLDKERLITLTKFFCKCLYPEADQDELIVSAYTGITGSAGEQAKRFTGEFPFTSGPLLDEMDGDN